MRCICCDREYEYKHGIDPAWGYNYCSEKCRKIDTMTADFLEQNISRDEIKGELKKMGITNARSCPVGARPVLKILFKK